jgi:hypothetical protein
LSILQTEERENRSISMGVFDRILVKISYLEKGKPMTIKQKAKPFWLQIDTLRCGMDWTEEDLERP